jgi:AcrR family transcriptional regulator
MARPRTVDDDTILAAAAEAIGEHGPADLTLAMVSAKVGLSPATLLQRFGSKRGLLLAVAESGSGWAEGTFRSAMARHRSPLRALSAALRAMTSPVASPETMANQLAFLQIDLHDPDFHRLALAHSRTVRDSIRALLDDAVAAGELRRTDTRRLAEAVEVVYNGALITWAIHRSGPVDRWLARQLDTVLAPHRAAALSPAPSPR